MGGVAAQEIYEHIATDPISVYEKIATVGTFGTITAGILALAVDVASNVDDLRKK